MAASSLILPLILSWAAVVGQDKTIDECIQALKSPDKEARKKAGWTLCFQASRAGAAVPALKEAVKDPERDVRLICAIALPRIDPSIVDPVMPQLIEGLDAEKELWHRENAACSLSMIGKKSKPALASLIRALGAALPDPAKDRDGAEATVRLWMFSAIALGNVGPEAKEAVPVLKKMADLEEKAVGGANTADARKSAREALEKIVGKDR